MDSRGADSQRTLRLVKTAARGAHRVLLSLHFRAVNGVLLKVMDNQLRYIS